MADIYEWLGGLNQTLGAQSEPRDGDLFTGISMDEIIPFDLDEDDNMYFEYPPIDPSLYTIDPSVPATLGQSIVTVPEEFAEASSKLLIYLIQILEIPEIIEDVDERVTEKMTFTAEELEVLNPIIEEDSESSIPTEIDGVRVNAKPKSREIKEIIDLRRIGFDRQTFYLARTVRGIYYWFHSPYTGRDDRLRKLIGDHRRKSGRKLSARKHTQSEIWEAGGKSGCNGSYLERSEICVNVYWTCSATCMNVCIFIW